MTQPPYEDRILRVLDYIHDNPAGDLSLDALADVAAMSRFHWHRIFRAMTGETCAQAVRRVRLHRAAGWLLDTKDPVAGIARRCGMQNDRSFARAFSEHYGLSPAEFRARGERRAQIRTRTKGETPMLDVAIKDLPARTLVGMDHTGSYFGIGRTFEKLGATLGTRSLWPQVGLMVGVYYDDPSAVAPEALRSFAGAVVSEGFPFEDPLQRVDLPAGRHAVMQVKGPYAELPGAYEDLYGRWLPQSGEIPADAAPYEIYLNSPMDTAPEDLVTDICLPLQG